MPTATETMSVSERIAPDHMDAAGRFITAVLAADPLSAVLGQEYVTAESERLWDRFVTRYTAVTSGAYAKHGADALRIALSSI